jgi:UDP-glucose 4-epimerase
VLDATLLDTAMQGVDAVVHLAARPSVPRSVADPVTAHEVNAGGTVAVLEAARAHGSPPVVVASSSSVYGANPALPKHAGLVPMPASPYAASKLAGESYALAYQRTYGLPVLALRFFNVYGPHQPADHAYAAVVPAFVDAALADRPLTIHGDGTQSRDFTFVDTVTAVLAEALRREVSRPEPVDLAYGDRTDLLTLVATLEAIVGRPLAVTHDEARPADVQHSQADPTALLEQFPGIEPVPLDLGLQATVDWFRTGA